MKKLEQKQDAGSKSRVLPIPPAHNPTKGVGKPLWPNSWTSPYPYPT